MVLGLSLVLCALCAVGLGWAVVKIVRRTPLSPTRRSDLALLGLLAVIELGLLVQLVVAGVGMARGHPVSATFLAYLIGILLILPAGTFWGLADRSRAGAGVLIVALVTVPAMIGRMHQVWSGSA